MKVSIGTKIKNGPWGGGNLFAINLSNFLKSSGHQVVYDLYDRDIDLKDLKVDNSIIQAIQNTPYSGNTDTLKKLVVEIEMLIGKEQSKTEEAYKQQIMLEKLQSKFNKGATEKDRPTEIVVEFINNASEKKTASQTKLWERCCDAYLQTLNRSH